MAHYGSLRDLKTNIERWRINHHSNSPLSSSSSPSSLPSTWPSPALSPPIFSPDTPTPKVRMPKVRMPLDTPYEPMPRVDWQTSSVDNVNVLVDQASRVRQMLRTKTLQLKLETEIRNWYVSRVDMNHEFKAAKHRQSRMLLEEISSEFVHEMEERELELVATYESKLNKLKFVMYQHTELSLVLQQQEQEEKKRMILNATITSTADKFVNIWKWRAVGRVVEKQTWQKAHTKHKAVYEEQRSTFQETALRTMSKMLRDQTKNSTQELESMIIDKFYKTNQRLIGLQAMVQKAKDHHMQSVESMVSAALRSRNDQKIAQLTTTLSPNVSPRFGGVNRKQRRFTFADHRALKIENATLDGKSFKTVLPPPSTTPKSNSNSNSNNNNNNSNNMTKKKTPLRSLTIQIEGSTDEESDEEIDGDKEQDEVQDEEQEVDLEVASIAMKDVSDFVVTKEHVGKIVWVQRVKSWGTIRYYGKLTKIGKANGTYVGVSLSLPKGLNDGTINGVRFFPCKPKYGIFVRANNVREHPLHGDPRKRRKRALDSLQAAASLKKTLARMVAKHK